MKTIEKNCMIISIDEEKNQLTLMIKGQSFTLISGIYEKSKANIIFNGLMVKN